MTLEFKKISKQFARLSEQAIRRKRAIEEVVPQVWQILKDHARDTELRERAKALAAEKRWRGAIPTDEPLDLICEPIAHPPQLTVVAGDGSQIYPDPHGAALYYLINVGTIIYRHGSGEAPLIDSEPSVYDETDMGFDEEEQSILVPSAALIDARRSLAEMKKLRDLALSETARSATVLLMDGQMAFFVRDPSITDREKQSLLDEYMACLDDLRQAHIATGGFFSRRKSMMVTSLARLALGKDPGDDAQSPAPPFMGVPDTSIFERELLPGHRSAAFEIAMKWNYAETDRYSYRSKGHSIHFFYVNVSHTTQPEIARVEVPEWVAKDRLLLDLIHTAIVQQCKSASNYPYVLSRAHEIAVVKEKEQATFEEMLLTRLAQQKIYLFPSGKASAKNALAGVE